MPERTITADIDGVERKIVADIPDGSTQEDILSAVEAYLANPPKPQMAPRPPKPGLPTPQEVISSFKMDRPWAQQVMEKLAETPMIPGPVGAGQKLLDVAQVAGAPLENLFRSIIGASGKAEAWGATGQPPKEPLRAPTIQEIMAPEEGRATVGDPQLDVWADILSALLPTSGLTPMLATRALKALKALRAANKLKEAAKLEAELMKASRGAEKELGIGDIFTTPERPGAAEIPIDELGSRIRGDEAAIQAQEELGPQAALIPNQILRPTEPEVRGAQQLGVTARTLPGRVLGDVGTGEAQRLEERIESLSTDLEVLKDSLARTKRASERTGIRDTRTERLLNETLRDKKVQLTQSKKDLKALNEARKPTQAPLPQEPSPIGEPPTTLGGQVKQLAKEGVEKVKDWFKRATPYLRSQDIYLENKGYSNVVEPIHRAIFNKDQFVSKYVDLYRQLQVKFKLDPKRSQQVIKVLNGEAQDAPADIQLAARELRRQIFDPIHAEVASDPALAQLIGPVGYIKDYFPHMEAAWLNSTKNPELVADMVHDLKPANLKSAFWKQRRFDSPEFNRDLDGVMNAYIHGSAKTKFDLTAYDEANRASSAINDATHKSIAVKYLRDYMGQPSSRLGAEAKEVTAPITKFYYRALIGANPASASINLSQTYLNTATKAGYKATGSAIKYVVKNWKKAQAEARAAGVLEGYPQISEGIFNSLKADLARKGFGDVADDFLFMAFKSSEQFNRMVAYFAGKAAYLAKAEKGARKAGNLGEFSQVNGATKWLGNSKTADEAQRAGWDMARETQFLYGKESPVPYAQIPVLGQFSNYPLKQAEFILNTIIRGDAAQRARLLAQYGSAAAAVAAYAKWKDQGPWSSINALAGDIMPVPGVGPGIVDMKKLLTYMYQVEQGKVDPGDIPMDALRAVAERTPGVRQVIRARRTK